MANIEAHHACMLLTALYACGGADGDIDPCKLDGQQPVVVVGQGRSAYAPLSDGAIMTVEAGPQGGHHIWVALRTKGLGSRGSVTSITGRVEEIPATVGPFDTIFELHPAGDGWCEVSGVRFQVDQEVPVEMFDGKTMSLTGRVTDKVGATAADTLDVVLTRQAP